MKLTDVTFDWSRLAPSPPELPARAAARLEELWPMLERWVNLNSFTGNHPGCEQVGEELERALELPGLRARRVAGRGAATHLAWTTPAWGQRPGVLLVGHHDTVFPPGTFEGFSADAEKVYGPGVLDMKGGLAIVRAALAALSDVGALADLPLALLSVSDEETGSTDGRRVVLELAGDAALGLVFEAGRANDAIVTRRKGTGKVIVTATGRAAHAGNDLAAGVNAIWALSRFIDGAQRLTRADGAATVNVGLVRGGTSANTVPAEARCEIDLRAVTRADADHVLDELRALAGQLGDESGASLALQGGMRRMPLEMTPRSERVAAHYGALAGALGLSAACAALVGGGSDANTLAEAGVPAIDGLGPRGRAFHTPEEHAEIASFAPRLAALLGFLLSCEGAGLLKA
ncbi:MAG: M20/M25/M40 family metallo-hydrolase [Kofleriaceae bacterium]